MASASCPSIQSALVNLMSLPQVIRIQELIDQKRISPKIVQQHSIVALCSYIFRDFLEENDRYPKILTELELENCIGLQWASNHLRNSQKMPDPYLFDGDSFHRTVLPVFLKAILRDNTEEFFKASLSKRSNVLVRTAKLFQKFVDLLKLQGPIFKEEVDHLHSLLIQEDLTQFYNHVMYKFDEGISDESLQKEFGHILKNSFL